MEKSRIVEANEKIAEKVVGSYKMIEATVVGGYAKIENAFVNRYLTHNGETVAEAKGRLRSEQAARQGAAAERKKHPHEKKIHTSKE